MVGTRVYVGGLSYRVGERDLERFFRSYGRLRDIVIKNGFAFVEFDDYRDADDAVYEMNGKELMGERVLVEFARGTRSAGNLYSSVYARKVRAPWMEKYGLPTRTDYRLIVENLSSRVSWQMLTMMMTDVDDDDDDRC
ncbi:hypothetical protein Pcinc_003958 [Petrolisthes cinctipes]|uniref:RRM domain-containing protein n=1 Tax=Petrolisthes cinctipes TaxID=88211 RepID=A0AAE1L465_PETCI|nr:hypothetical protein Pcinc_003958 [Petrolisthes cinctipes]